MSTRVTEEEIRTALALQGITVTRVNGPKNWFDMLFGFPSLYDEYKIDWKIGN